MSSAEDAGLADSFFRSRRVADSPIFPLEQFEPWFCAQRASKPMAVRRIAFAQLDQWRFTDAPRTLVHGSGKFFSVHGLRVETDFGSVPEWSQPIVQQPEIGILGVMTRVIDGVRHFLLQAKVEPGNTNGLQLSPTEQATRSNFTRVHGGAQAPYHQYFVEPGRARILIDRLQAEQGSRILRKRNRNMIVEVEDDIAVLDGFCWLTLGQIKRLLQRDNLVNMSLRSVLSCLPLADPACERGGALHSERAILNWLNGLRARYHMKLEMLPLDCIERWQTSEDEIRHETGRYFSVVAVEVEATGREVVRWSQPLLHHSGRGLNGFVLQRIEGVLHFLVRACMYPGNHELFELGSTVCRSNADELFGTPEAPPFLDLFQDPPQAWVRYCTVQSEEGGRFYHYQNQSVVLELPEEMRLDLLENFCWMTLGQIEDFVRHGYFNIEGRNLLACLDFSDLKS